MSKILKPFIALFKLIYRIIDKLIVTPISRVIYKVGEFSKDNSGKIEKILNRPIVLIYVSLICAIAMFLLVDYQVINLTEKNAEVLEGQPVEVDYNNETYVIEGVPEAVDITLIGSKSNIYLATQLGSNKVELDLSKYGVGTYKVKLKYNNSVSGVDYKLDPSTITVKISEKVSATKNLTYNLLNEDKLDATLSISNVKLDTNEVVVKSSQEILDKVAVVKALIDASQIELKESGEYTIDNVMLVAYDSNGNKVDNIEVVPSKVSATVTVDSYHASKQVKVITKGTMTNGKAIGNIVTSVKEVEVYGEKSIVDELNYIEAPISVDKLDSDKTMSVNLTKPSGVRYMSETTTNVTVSVGDASQKTISGVSVQVINLGSNYTAGAINTDESTVDVIVTGVQSIIENDIDSSNVTAYVDLSGYTPSSNAYSVPVTVKVDDERVSVKATKTEVSIKISEKKN